jgi:hypothetical protein
MCCKMIRRISYRSLYTACCIQNFLYGVLHTDLCMFKIGYGVLHTDLSIRRVAYRTFYTAYCIQISLCAKVCSGALRTQFCVPFCCTMSILVTSCVHVPHPCTLSLPTPLTITRTHARTHTRRPPPSQTPPTCNPRALSLVFPA